MVTKEAEDLLKNDEKALSVSRAMYLAKNALEGITTTVIGEVSELSNKSGYKAVYFTVKDESASMPCMMWKDRFKSANAEIRIGSLVRITGRFSLYAAKGRMNFEVFSLGLAGEGELRQRVANLAKALQREGLMDASKKRALPRYPQTIGLVTSPRGAAVRDVLRTLRKLHPAARVVFAGVPVEGANAPHDLIEALQATVDAHAEVVLLVRGGGSYEDLMPFNDEALARFIADMPIPVVTGIGHEPDTTIADMVADCRTSTPTFAAQEVSTDFQNARTNLERAARTMSASLDSRLKQSALRLDSLAQRPVLSDPRQMFLSDSNKLVSFQDRLQRAIPASLEYSRTRLANDSSRMSRAGEQMLAAFEARFSLGASRLNDLSPLAILARGYAVAYTNEGRVLRGTDDVTPGDRIDVKTANARLNCTVESVDKTEIVSVDWEE